MSLMDHIALEPMWLQAWVNWMVFINLASLLFVWSRIEPRWVIVAFSGAVITMNYLYSLYGYEKILGLAHIIFWTPLVIYIFRRRYKIGRDGLAPIYLAILFTTNLISLAADYFDLASYLLNGPQS